MSHTLTGIEWVIGSGFDKPGELTSGIAGGRSIDQQEANVRSVLDNSAVSTSGLERRRVLAYDLEATGAPDG